MPEEIINIYITELKTNIFIYILIYFRVVKSPAADTTDAPQP
jgi:hypothetical protein